MVCGACGALSPEGFKFCGQCASLLQPASSALEERKVVTSLFCDLVGFTAMSEAADPEDVRALLGRYFAVARSTIESFGGVVEKFIGDAVVGVFGVPAVHEDDPERAVRAGLRIVEAVEGFTRLDGSVLQLRVGINTGEALVRLDVRPGWGEGFLTGDAVNTAARIQSIAPVMGVAVGRSTFEATRRVFDYAELDPASVKGKSEPVEVWHAVAPLARFGTDIARRHDSPLVGREIDLALLKGTFDKTVAASSPQLVTIVGEPGLGKSRLVAELGSYVDGLSTLVTWRQGRCLPYGEGITFWALGEVVKGHAGILDTDAADVALSKLEAVLPEVEERPWLRQRLLPLLGIEASSAAEQVELFTAWRTFMESIAEAGPMVVVFEDLHWADPALLAFLEHLAGHAAGVPLLMVATARPELFDEQPDYGRGLRNTTTINLAPLTEPETERLVSALLDTLVVPEELRTPLLERAGGNPLFAEEYVRLLRDRGLLERLDDQVHLREGTELPLPESVQALLAARLDTLDPDRKALLADAAVVGKVFWAGAVAAMAERDGAEVLEVMRELSLKELVRPVRHSSMAGQAEYTFSHALARDVAYEQLPRASRAARHVAAARWVQRQAQERVEDVADVLAHHYSTALDLAEATGETALAAEVQPAALRFLVLAGERATGLDPDSALIFLRRAVALAPVGDPQRARTLASYGQAALYAGQLVEAQPALEEAAGMFSATGDMPAAIDALTFLTGVLARRGDPSWRTIPDQMQELVADLPVGPVHVEVYSRLAINEALGNETEAAITHANAALGLANDLGLDPALRAPLNALAFRGTARCTAGDEGGLDDLAEAITLGTDAGHGRFVGIFYYNLASVMPLFRGPAAAAEAIRQGMTYCDATGQTAVSLTLAIGRLEPLIRMGALTEVLTTVDQLTPALEAADDQQDLLQLRATWVQALVLQGRAGQATHLLDWMVATGRDMSAPEYAVDGEGAAALAHAASGRPDPAVALFNDLVHRPDVGLTPNGTCQLPSWVRTLVDLGEPGLAQRLAANLSTTNPLTQHVHIATGATLAEARGDHFTALAAYTDTAQRMHDFTVYVEEAFALLGQGRCLLALDRPEEAVRVLEKARAMFTKMDARPTLTEIESLFANIKT